MNRRLELIGSVCPDQNKTCLKLNRPCVLGIFKWPFTRNPNTPNLTYRELGCLLVTKDVVPFVAATPMVTKKALSLHSGLGGFIQFQDRSANRAHA
jgi:hypothetical protein